jgi:tripartite-type tricarboxylate transporter receptor subunit TctC
MVKSLGQRIIIENVTGADGSIGVGRAARARPDGCTIDLGNNATHILNGALYSLTYDVLNDFAPIAPLVTSTFVLFARKTMPAKDLNELIAWLKANPNRASMGTANSIARVVTAFFQKETGTQLTIVPYRGFTPAMQDLVAGQIDLLFEAPNGLSLVQAGSVKAYAVTSDTRLTLAPDIPTVSELGLPALSFPWPIGRCNRGSRGPECTFQFTRDHRGFCFLARERLESADIFLRPRTQLRGLCHLPSLHQCCQRINSHHKSKWSACWCSR